MVSLVVFDDYPIEKLSLMASLLNPIDLSRILVILRLDISVLLGYTGAVFQDFFGRNWGMLLSFLVLLVWVVIPVRMFLRAVRRKDF